MSFRFGDPDENRPWCYRTAGTHTGIATVTPDCCYPTDCPFRFSMIDKMKKTSQGCLFHFGDPDENRPRCYRTVGTHTGIATATPGCCYPSDCPFRFSMIGKRKKTSRGCLFLLVTRTRIELVLPP